jgi:hypothetical protein
MAKNTTATIAEGKKFSDVELQAEVKAANDVFKEERLVKTSIPKSYQKFIGETLPVGINGSFIVLPVDGTTHEIPETFADFVREYLNNITT